MSNQITNRGKPFKNMEAVLLVLEWDTMCGWNIPVSLEYKVGKNAHVMSKYKPSKYPNIYKLQKNTPHAKNINTVNVASHTLFKALSRWSRKPFPACISVSPPKLHCDNLKSHLLTWIICRQEQNLAENQQLPLPDYCKGRTVRARE